MTTIRDALSISRKISDPTIFTTIGFIADDNATIIIASIFIGYNSLYLY